MIVFVGYGEEAHAFLAAFEQAQLAMRRATEAMLAVSRAAETEEERRHYDRVHKHLVRLCAEWNRTEHEREARGER